MVSKDQYERIDARFRSQMSKNVRRQIRQYVSPSEASEQAKGPVDYAVSE